MAPIGHDNWADVNPEDMAKIELAQNRDIYVKTLSTHGTPNPTDEQLLSFIKAGFAKIDFTKLKVIAVCLFCAR